jgi:tetrahydromethanopterin S-methyltransferase subunit B
MNDQCKKAWNPELLCSIFTKKFIGGAYKKRRENLLFERERSMLPETQPYAENLKEIFEFEKKEQPIIKELDKIKITLKNLQSQYFRITNLEQRLPVHKQIMEAKIKQFTLKTEKEYLNYQKHIIQRRLNQAVGNQPQEERRTFVRACPANDCKGFLSSGWKCGLCEVRVCADCHEIKETKQQYDARHPKGANSPATGPAPQHTCLKENLETALVLKNECKNCPKCAASIFKIEGCDQMYCTQCQTAFSWRTGRIETGTIHNPHYYDYLRRLNNGAIPRNPGDIPCGGLPTAYDLRKFYENLKLDKELVNALSLIHRVHAHIQNVELPHYVTNAVTDNRELRAAYLINKIDETKFKAILQKNEKARNKKNEIRMILDMLLATIADIFRNILQCTNIGEILEKIDELNNLRKYCNDSMKPISKRYTCVAPFINDNWVYTTCSY